MSMFMYAVGTLPLIQSLKTFDGWVQIWYADDSSGSGDLPKLCDWLKLLTRIGPRFYYFLEPSKSCVVVKESLVDYAEGFFHDISVNVVTSERTLREVFNDRYGRDSFTTGKVQERLHHVQ